MTDYIFYKPCVTNDEIKRAVLVKRKEKDDIFVIRMGDGFYSYNAKIPGSCVLDSFEGERLWLHQKIKKLEERVTLLEYRQHTHTVFGKKVK